MSAHDGLSEAEVLRRYPELRPLVALKDQGWQFHNLVLDGEPVLVAERRQQDCVDSLWLFDRKQLVGLRTLDDAPGASGGPVWYQAGEVAEVVAATTGLPPPDAPGAPRLVLTRSRSLLWLPGHK